MPIFLLPKNYKTFQNRWLRKNSKWLKNSWYRKTLTRLRNIILKIVNLPTTTPWFYYEINTAVSRPQEQATNFELQRGLLALNIWKQHNIEIYPLALRIGCNGNFWFIGKKNGTWITGTGTGGPTVKNGTWNYDIQKQQLNITVKKLPANLKPLVEQHGRITLFPLPDWLHFHEHRDKILQTATDLANSELVWADPEWEDITNYLNIAKAIHPGNNTSCTNNKNSCKLPGECVNTQQKQKEQILCGIDV